MWTLSAGKFFSFTAFPPCLQYLPGTRYVLGGGRETNRESAAAANTRQASAALSLEEGAQDWKFLSGSVAHLLRADQQEVGRGAEHEENAP